MSKTNFYIFKQTNSAGYFVVDDNVCNRVVIEAIDEEHAKNIISPMIKNQCNECSCCADRWQIDCPDIIDLDYIKKVGYEVDKYCLTGDLEVKDSIEKEWFKYYGKYPILKSPSWIPANFVSLNLFKGSIYFRTIEEFCQFLANEFDWVRTTPDTRIHYLDGTKKEIFADGTT